jgi:hypothetical protein
MIGVVWPRAEWAAACSCPGGSLLIALAAQLRLSFHSPVFVTGKLSLHSFAALYGASEVLPPVTYITLGVLGAGFRRGAGMARFLGPTADDRSSPRHLSWDG